MLHEWNRIWHFKICLFAHFLSYSSIDLLALHWVCYAIHLPVILHCTIVESTFKPCEFEQSGLIQDYSWSHPLIRVTALTLSGSTRILPHTAPHPLLTHCVLTVWFWWFTALFKALPFRTPIAWTEAWPPLPQSVEHFSVPCLAILKVVSFSLCSFENSYQYT